MSASVKHDLKKIFQRIPLLADNNLEDFEIVKLAGLSNINYRLTNNAFDLILRIPQSQTNNYINRDHEAFNTNIAMQLGLSPNCLWRNDEGVSLTQTIPHSQSLSKNDLRNKSLIKKVADKLKKLHSNQVSFKGEVNLGKLLKRYFEMLDTDSQHKIKHRYESARCKLESLKSSQTTLVPSHNDLNENNLLLDKYKQLWLIDWEYSSMASPYWDLATICNSTDYNHVQCDFLLQAYDNENHQFDLEILLNYREILAVLNDCWLNVFTR